MIWIFQGAGHAAAVIVLQESCHSSPTSQYSKVITRRFGIHFPSDPPRASCALLSRDEPKWANQFNFTFTRGTGGGGGVGGRLAPARCARFLCGWQMDKWTSSVLEVCCCCRAEALDEGISVGLSRPRLAENGASITDLGRMGRTRGTRQLAAMRSWLADGYGVRSVRAWSDVGKAAAAAGQTFRNGPLL